MSAILCVPSTSKEFVHVPITASVSNLASYPVDMAVVAYGAEPASGDWKTAAWDSGVAKILIGPGSSAVGALVEGIYGVWVRITTVEEEPVLYSGAVRIT